GHVTGHSRIGLVVGHERAVEEECDTCSDGGACKERDHDDREDGMAPDDVQNSSHLGPARHLGTRPPPGCIVARQASNIRTSHSSWLLSERPLKCWDQAARM